MLRRLSVLTVAILSLLALASAAQAHQTGHADRASLPALTASSSDVAVYGYLHALGIRTHHLVIQRGLRNYAGPHCPGQGWTCTRSREAVQLGAARNGSNVFACAGKATGGGCIVLQATPTTGTRGALGRTLASVGQNTASCTQTGNTSSQRCLVIQSSSSNRNVATITQTATQSSTAASSSQTVAQTGSVYQCSLSGPNVATVTQTVSQAGSAGGSTRVAQSQASTQTYLIQQAGPPTGQSACPAPNPQAPPAFSQVCPTMTGTNTATATQTVTQTGMATSASAGAQSQNSDLEGHVDQCSTNVSTYNDAQYETQKLRAGTSGVTQTQVGPMLAAGGLTVADHGDARSLQHVRCCSFQGTNPADTCTIKQTTNQNANPWATATEAVSSLGQTTGNCSAGISATQNGVTSTASSSGSQVNAGLNCANGACTGNTTPTKLVYTGDTSADHHDAATLSAVLTRTDTGATLAGQPVNLAVGAEQCSATTDQTGLATCTVTIGDAPGAYTATGHFAGTSSFAASDASSPFTVNKEQTAIVYTGDVTADYHDVATLSASLSEGADGSSGDTTPAISGEPVTLTLGSQSCNATTNTDGNASCTVHVEQAPGTIAVGAAYAGNGNYLPSSSSAATFTITKEQTAVAYTGDVTADYHDVATLSATLSEAGDGSTGDTAPPISGEPVTLTLGSQSCNATSDQAGNASCTVHVEQAPGTVAVGAAYAGNGNYLPSSSSAATFTITKEQTAITYTGPSVFEFHDPATLSATLREGADGSSGDTTPPISGEPVTLTLGSQSCSATTDASGGASCTIASVTQAPASGVGVGASFAGDGNYLASTSSPATATINREDTTIVYTGPTTGETTDPLMVSARLYEDAPLPAAPVPLANRTVTLAIGADSCSATTDANGNASCQIAHVGAAPGPTSIVATFAGDSSYLGSSAATPFTVTVDEPDFPGQP